MTDEAMSTRRFAKRVGYHYRTVLRWISEGVIVPGRGPGGRGHYRFTEAHVQLVLRGRASERALDLEAHVLAARSSLRRRRRGA